MKWNDFFSISKGLVVDISSFGGIAFLLFYVLFEIGGIIKKFRIRFPRAKDYLREIGYSILTIAIFTSVTVFFVKNPPVTKYTFYYRDIAQHGRFYFFADIPVALYYCTTLIFIGCIVGCTAGNVRHFHKVHHLSTNPSPWAAYAFHPLEAVVGSGYSAGLSFYLAHSFLTSPHISSW